MDADKCWISGSAANDHAKIVDLAGINKRMVYERKREKMEDKYLIDDIRNDLNNPVHTIPGRKGFHSDDLFSLRKE